MSKTPVSLLQELLIKQGCIPNYDYDVKNNGICSSFICRVTCTDLSAEGIGSNKKEAKHNAAKNMLSLLSSNKKDEVQILSPVPSSVSSNINNMSIKPTKICEAASLLRMQPSPTFMNYVGMLQEFCTQHGYKSVSYDVEETGPPHMRIFIIEAKVESLRKRGTAHNKKDAKQEAAKLLLQDLNGLNESTQANVLEQVKCEQVLPIPELTKLAESTTCKNLSTNDIGGGKEEAKNNATKNMLSLLSSNKKDETQMSFSSSSMSSTTNSMICIGPTKTCEAASLLRMQPSPIFMNYVGMLQEFCVRHGFKNVSYHDVEETGPSQIKMFIIEAKVESLRKRGTAHNKKNAKQEAAKLLLQDLNDLNEATQTNVQKQDKNNADFQQMFEANVPKLDVGTVKCEQVLPIPELTKLAESTTCKNLSTDDIGGGKEEAKNNATKNMLSLLSSNKKDETQMSFPSSSMSSTTNNIICIEPIKTYEAASLLRMQPSPIFMNYVGMLQEFCVRHGFKNVSYHDVEETGPSQMKMFIIEAKVESLRKRGTAHNKKDAKQEAAKLLLQDLNGLNEATQTNVQKQDKNNADFQQMFEANVPKLDVGTVKCEQVSIPELTKWAESTTCKDLSTDDIGGNKEKAKIDAAKNMLSSNKKDDVQMSSSSISSSRNDITYITLTEASQTASLLRMQSNPVINYVGKLQEFCAQHDKNILYDVVEEIGPSHMRMYTVEAKVESLRKRCTAHNKKDAKQEVAKLLLQDLNGLNESTQANVQEQEIGIVNCEQVLPNPELTKWAESTTCKNLSTDDIEGSKEKAKNDAAKNMLSLLSSNKKDETQMSFPSSSVSSTNNIICMGPTRSYETISPLKVQPNPTFIDYIGLLQEFCTQHDLKNVWYDVIEETGPSHMRTFTVEAKVGSLRNTSAAHSIKRAKQEAAKLLLQDLEALKQDKDNAGFEQIFGNNVDELNIEIAKYKGLTIQELTKRAESLYIQHTQSRKKIPQNYLIKNCHTLFTTIYSNNIPNSMREKMRMICDKYADQRDLIQKMMKDIESILGVELQQISIKSFGKNCIICLRLMCHPNITQIGIGKTIDKAKIQAMYNIILTISTFLS